MEIPRCGPGKPSRNNCCKGQRWRKQDQPQWLATERPWSRHLVFTRWLLVTDWSSTLCVSEIGTRGQWKETEVQGGIITAEQAKLHVVCPTATAPGAHFSSALSQSNADSLTVLTLNRWQAYGFYELPSAKFHLPDCPSMPFAPEHDSQYQSHDQVSRSVKTQRWWRFLGGAWTSGDMSVGPDEG